MQPIDGASRRCLWAWFTARRDAERHAQRCIGAVGSAKERPPSAPRGSKLVFDPWSFGLPPPG